MGNLGNCKSLEAGGPELKTHLLALNNAPLSGVQALTSPFGTIGFNGGQREGYCCCVNIRFRPSWIRGEFQQRPGQIDPVHKDCLMSV